MPSSSKRRRSATAHLFGAYHQGAARRIDARAVEHALRHRAEAAASRRDLAARAHRLTVASR